MATTLATLNSLVNDRRRDTSNDTVDMTGDGFRAINGALQIWTQTHDWEWQIEKTTITYNEGITTYSLGSSLAFKALKDVRPQKAKATELFYLSNNKFDSDSIRTYKCALKTEAQAKYMRIKYTGNQTTVHNATDHDDNGTWVGATAISNVGTDSYESFDKSASISFDYSGTSGTLTVSDMTALDLSRYYRRSTLYFNLDLVDVTDFTSVTVKLGTDASNYITGSITTDYLGNSLVNGFNKLSLVWDGSTTEVGTVDKEDIKYIQLTIAYGSDPSTTNNHIENFFISENVPIDVEYYSTNMTVDISNSNAKEQIFNDSSATGDTTLWSGEWDYVNEAFVNSVMEIISWLTGETEDRSVAIQRIQGFVEPLKRRMPSKRRHPEITMTADINN